MKKIAKEQRNFCNSGGKNSEKSPKEMHFRHHYL